MISIKKQESLLKGFSLLKNNLSDKEQRFMLTFDSNLICSLLIDAINGKLAEDKDDDKYIMFKNLLNWFNFCNPYTIETIDGQLKAYKLAEFCTDFVYKFESKEDLELLLDLFDNLYNDEFNFIEAYEEFLD